VSSRFSQFTAHATSRSRSTVFFQVPLPLIRFSGALRSALLSHADALHVLCTGFLSVCPSHAGIVSKLGMYRIAIFKIRQEPYSTGYQTNYPAGTRYLDTCCIIANFFDYFVVQIKKMYYSVCLHFKTTTRNHTTLSLFYSNVFTIWRWVN